MSPSLKMVAFLFLLSCPAFGQGYSSSHHGSPANLPNGCSTCHVGHGVPDTPMLSTDVNDSCFVCHGDLGSRLTVIRNGYLPNRFINMPDIALASRKRYNHFKPTFQSHTPLTGQDNNCTACHNPHYGYLLNPFERVRGITIQGIATLESQYEYEVCFRCHSSVAGQPATNLRDIRKEFYGALALSSHPIDHAVASVQSNLPSLINQGEPYVMTCSTCHGNSDGRGPGGIHGSDFPFLLKRRVEVNDHIPDSPEGNDLCYSCHDRDSILNNESFTYHAEHLLGQFSATPCLTCHSAHGSLTSPFLITFDPDIVFPTKFGQVVYRSTGVHSGTCDLICHGKEHVDSSYSTAPGETRKRLKRSIFIPRRPFPQ